MFRKSKTLKDTFTSSKSNLLFNSNNSLNINTSNNNITSNNNTTFSTTTTKQNTTKTNNPLHNYNFKQIHLSNSINIFKPNNDSTKNKINKITYSKSPSNQKMTKSNTIVYTTLVNNESNIKTPQKKTVSFNSITDLKLSYNKQIAEKDLKIEKLQKELKFYKSQYMKLNICKNKQISLMKTPLSNKNFSHQRNIFNNFHLNSTIQQQAKNSFEFNGNQSYIKKQHERELSERINNFYTPKANELMKNFNITKTIQERNVNKGMNAQNSLTISKKSLSKNNKENIFLKKSMKTNVTCKNNRNERKDLFALTIPNEYLKDIIGIGGNYICESNNTNKSNSVTTTISTINYVGSLNGIIKRMNTIVDKVFALKEK